MFADFEATLASNQRKPARTSKRILRSNALKDSELSHSPCKKFKTITTTTAIDQESSIQQESETVSDMKFEHQDTLHRNSTPARLKTRREQEIVKLMIQELGHLGYRFNYSKNPN